MEINFECQKCKKIFDCDVGQVLIDEKTMRPKFEKKLVCPKCGELTMEMGSSLCLTLDGKREE